MNIISALNVYDVNSKKVRVGNDFDGGYVINEILLNQSKRLVSVGMGGEDSFERDWFKKLPNTTIEAYDGTYPCAALCEHNKMFVNKRIFYINHNVGYEEKYIPLNAIIETKTNTLLKVDIEGGEYTVFDNVDLSNVTGLLLEVHDLHIPENRDKLIDLIENQFSELMLFHVHGNVWGGSFDLNLSKNPNNPNGIIVKEFPFVMELSFINKKLVSEFKIDEGTFPIEGVDATNKQDSPDLQLPWINAL
jgi:hypothetical protein